MTVCRGAWRGGRGPPDCVSGAWLLLALLTCLLAGVGGVRMTSLSRYQSATFTPNISDNNLRLLQVNHVTGDVYLGAVNYLFRWAID